MTDNNASERVAQARYEIEYNATHADSYMPTEGFRIALAAARAGEAEPTPDLSDLAAVYAHGYTSARDPEVARFDAHNQGLRAVRDAVLSAQRGGKAVDREALVLMLHQAGVARAAALADSVLDLLAARGGATPTEVEWGVRMPDGSIETCGAPGSDDDFTDDYVSEYGGIRVRRTVSAWREVEGG